MTGTPAASVQGAPAPGPRERLRSALVRLGIRIVCLLPERPLMAAADPVGGIWYRVAARRRDQARLNLARVTRWMAEQEIGTDLGRAAGRDARILEDLVRAAFRHSVRYNLILARGPTFDDRYVDRWVRIDTPEVLERALADPSGALFVGLHMASAELPALYLARITGRLAVAPTETLDDPVLQAQMVDARLRLGLRLVELRQAKREMVAALRRGDPVGILGDRDISGGGVEVDFFGAPAPLPVGPALLAVETGVVPRVFGIRRTEDGIYHAVIEPVPAPTEGTLRERVTAYLAAEARVFERRVAEAPEQWFAVFFPIWKDAVA